MLGEFDFYLFVGALCVGFTEALLNFKSKVFSTVGSSAVVLVLIMVFKLLGPSLLGSRYDTFLLL